jgi:hypothetical protein
MSVRVAVVGVVIALVGASATVFMVQGGENYEFQALADLAAEMSMSTTTTTTSTSTTASTTTSTVVTTTTTTAPPPTEAPVTTAAPAPPPPPDTVRPPLDTTPAPGTGEVSEAECQAFLAEVQSHDRLPTSGEVMWLWHFCGIRI